MAPASVNRLMQLYRYKVIQGEKCIDPRQMLRQRCKRCCKCKGAGCADVMKDLPEF
jgi:hypothetical protein